MSSYVLPFDAIGSADLPRVGGKGANLGEMSNAGMPVPPGFCVTTEAFDELLGACVEAPELMAAIDALAADDLEGIRALGQQLRAAIEATALPDSVEAAIRAAFATLDPELEHAYAVRSSATLEDLAEASFAGQQDTYLNIRGIEQLLDRIRACSASLFSDRAIAYRHQRGFGSDIAKLSVVVQRMVQAELAGILFTADPVSGHRGVASIDASYGLGEALVSGIVDADNYRVRRRDRSLIEVRLGAKAVEIVATPTGTEPREVEADRRERRALDEATLMALVELGERVEAHYGAPQDLEWCVEAGALYLVQTRPITTLFPIPSGPLPGHGRPADLEPGLRVYVSFNHVQVMTDPISPLGMDTMAHVLPVGKRQTLERSPVMWQAGGRLYFDATPAMQRRLLRELVPRVMTLLDPKMAAMLREVSGREAFLARDGRAPATLGPFVRRMVLPVVRGGLPNFLWRDPEAARARLERLVDEVPGQWRAQLEAADPPRARLDAAQALVSTVLEHLLHHFFPVVLPGVIAWKRLRAMTGDDPRVGDLTRGLEGNATTQMDLELGDLADIARAHPALRQHLLDHGEVVGPAGEAALDQLEGGGEFLAGWRRYIERYGHRGIGEIDLATPRWADDPSSLLRSLAGLLREPEPGGHRRQHAAAAAQAERSARELIAEAGPLRRRRVRRLVALMRTGLALREHPKMMIMRGFGFAREQLLSIGDTLVAAGRLQAREDVWWLDYDELAAALDELGDAGGVELAPRIAARRLAYRGFAGLRPPRVLTSEGEIPRPARDTELPPGTHAGVSASAGVVEGVARVILDPRTEVLHHGEILVAPFTDPGWTPLFIHASALVMEVGGLMTHGSVVAREYGIPAVVGVDHATTLFRTGQRLRVDGDAGLVTVLSDPPPG